MEQKWVQRRVAGAVIRVRAGPWDRGAASAGAGPSHPCPWSGIRHGRDAAGVLLLLASTPCHPHGNMREHDSSWLPYRPGGGGGDGGKSGKGGVEGDL